MQPASEVGGDYYDVIAHDGRVVIGIGDVTGHGLESGVLSIMLQTAVRTLLMSGESDNHRIFETLNRVMYDSARRMQCDRNLTLTLLTFDGSVATISGQHEEIIVLRRNGLLERYDTLDLGFPLGIEPTISGLIAEQQIRLDAGDVVVLYTDGITEAINAAGVAFGLERLAQTVRESNHKSSALIRDAVLSRVRSHIGGCKLLDDMTVVVFKPYVHNVADIRNDKGNLGANRLTQADVSQQTDALHA
jgi:sigma-B regulation protein RsbU (phosphoserine phosphatase)